MFRVYMRCSTEEQTLDSQRHACEAWLTARNASEVKWYEDEAFTGANQNRPAFKRLIKEAKAGDTIVAYAMNRMTREGIAPALNLLQSFKDKGIKFVSLTEAWLADDSPVAEIVIAVLSWADKQERLRINARQMAGIAAVRAKNNGRCPWGGRKVGTRIKLTDEVTKAIIDMKKSGTSISEIARVVHVTRPTVYVALSKQSA